MMMMMMMMKLDDICRRVFDGHVYFTGKRASER